MRTKINLTSRWLLLLLIVLLTSCTRAAYERMEERSLPRYQQGAPVMSNILSTCKRVDLFEPGNFKLSYDRLEDLTVYPTPPQYPPRFESKYCISGERKILHIDAKEPLPSEQKANTGYRNDEAIKYAECISYSAPNVCRQLGVRKANTDPNKGALKAWSLIGIKMDGLNWKSLMVHFDAVVVEGDKMPLGITGTFNNYKKDEVIIEKLTIHNREWEHLQGIPTLDSFGRLSGAPDLYKTKINKYTLFVRGGYSHQIINNPVWLAKRRAFLRQWVETFKIEPLPTDYK